MPIIGLGTWTLSNDEAENSVYHALKSGMRLIDTARYYGNEVGVGRGLRRGDIMGTSVFHAMTARSGLKLLFLSKKKKTSNYSAPLLLRTLRVLRCGRTERFHRLSAPWNRSDPSDKQAVLNNYKN